LHNFVDRDILPEAYGGMLRNGEAEESDLIQKVMEREQDFRGKWKNC